MINQQDAPCDGVDGSLTSQFCEKARDVVLKEKNGHWPARHTVARATFPAIIPEPCRQGHGFPETGRMRR